MGVVSVLRRHPRNHYCKDLIGLMPLRCGGIGTLNQRETEMKIHDLKIWPEHFEALMTGEKTCEVRLNDRGYLPGDMLHLREFKPEESRYTQREMTRMVTHITDGEDSGVMHGYVVLSVRHCPLKW